MSLLGISLKGTGFSPYVLNLIKNSGLQPLGEIRAWKSDEGIGLSIFNQPCLYRIPANISKVVLPVFLIANSMIRKTRLPDIGFPCELSFCTEGKPALNELYCSLQAVLSHDEQVQVVGHDHIGVQ